MVVRSQKCSELSRSPPHSTSDSHHATMVNPKEAEPTEQQWLALLDSVSRWKVMLGDFSGQGAGAAGRHDELWSQVSHRLNHMGGGLKSAEKWKEAFCNLKGRAKRQFCERARHIRATGGGPARPEDLNPSALGMSRIYCRAMEFVPKDQLFGHAGVADPLQVYQS
ncbi:Aspartate aminotransferase, cytoplasmic [Frankliniella fusca]|uniref:Regulatory protein zeste n=1 Tax=Frankliniella fusca TaxID=407009 RepID=A0AAE1HDX6_9NEOP|nr:Aspartate aminotransferase, cytoplasmic [Frankliniella fusca]